MDCSNEPVALRIGDACAFEVDITDDSDVPVPIDARYSSVEFTLQSAWGDVAEVYARLKAPDDIEVDYAAGKATVTIPASASALIPQKPVARALPALLRFSASADDVWSVAVPMIAMPGVKPE